MPPRGQLQGEPFTPFTVTAPADPAPVFQGIPRRNAYWIVVAVRDMGTSGWVAIGDSVAQESRMYLANDFWIFDVPYPLTLNVARYYVKSENGDAVLEVTAMGPPTSFDPSSIQG